MRSFGRARRLPLVVVAAVVAGVLVLGVFPTRSFVAQRRDIAEAGERVEILRAENSRLRGRVEDLQEDHEVERLAREQYGLVKPGEEAYAILPGPADPEPAVPAASAPAPATSRHDRGFWASLGDALTFWN